jgi:mannose-6-phosphate isomerase-like protein (cupin superfamily)
VEQLARIIAAGGALAAGIALAACEQQSAAPAENGTEIVDANQDAAANGAARATEPPLARAAADPNLQWGPCPEGLPKGCGIAVLHGDPAQPKADIFLRLPGGSVVPPHTHTSTERMILVSGDLAVKYRGAPEAVLRAGHYAYGPAKLPHRAECRGSEACVLFIAFQDPVDLIPYEGPLE